MDKGGLPEPTGDRFFNGFFDMNFLLFYESWDLWDWGDFRSEMLLNSVNWPLLPENLEDGSILGVIFLKTFLLASSSLKRLGINFTSFASDLRSWVFVSSSKGLCMKFYASSLIYLISVSVGLTMLEPYLRSVLRIWAVLLFSMESSLKASFITF